MRACLKRSFAPLMLTMLVTVLTAMAALACSPEARRVRDGGPGADPGNKVLVVRDEPDPHAADSTLWPGRDPAPVDVLARGVAPPPTYPAAERTPTEHGEANGAPTANPRHETNRP
jgi:hypothetical protein